ncbi:extracellular solute-binding protein [Cryobacterium sp. M15]|jgi:multiple sugar transport system substrate-binding protein/raffinose/stachyose/melibiose transport system substrate-binding protein|uniref:extracellular solute-binding protein n=1 Tax=Cryobacterium sp. M15 TaxID=2048291 RepID=UPI000CE2D9A3|nr:extracellular solute-binding protein [Cryobacterium sp. M15]
MKRKNRFAGILALAASTALLASGCASGGDSGQGDSVALTFWQNSTTGEGKAYWEKTISEFEAANPKVTIEMQSVQNEEMDGKLQTALNSGDAPDIFMARGGGKLADVVAAGQAMDITDSIDDVTKAAVPEGVLSAFAVDGKIYGMPTAVLPGGIFYSKDLFAEAGIDAVPTTLDELDAAVDKLKATGVAPIAVGAKDAWPAAHWYYFFAQRACSQDAMNEAAKTKTFDDSCWLQASENMQTFVKTEPFNQGFLTTSAQQGAGSSAGLLANHEAAMELMGAWNPGVIASLTPDQKPLPDLGWFPFPEVTGGDGTPGAMMGGVDGFTCSAQAPKQECTDFLNFFMQKQQQEGYANAFHTLPANTDAQSVVADPALQSILKAYNDAPYVTVWLDTLFGQNVGTALNTGVVDMLAGKGGAADLVSGVNAAAAKG